MFYSGDECDPNNRSMDDVYACEPFTDYFRQWMCKPDPDDPDNIGKKQLWTDIRYVNAQYDASIAYMDASLAQLFQYLDDNGFAGRDAFESSLPTTVKNWMSMNSGMTTTGCTRQIAIFR